MQTLRDLIRFVVTHRVYWLVPILAILLLLGVLFFAPQGGLMPFIYAIF